MAAHENIIANLKEQNAHLARQLLDRELADARAAQERRAKEQATVDAKDAAARMDALNADIEQTRRGSWFGHLLASDNSDKPVDPIAISDAVPAHGWPPGDGPHNYHFAGQHVGVVADDVTQTSMAKLLAAKGFKL